MNPICPYCNCESRKATGTDIYPHRPDLRKKVFYQCVPCDAHVGCHPGTEKPLGRLADAELRAAKMAAHAAFDPLWKSGERSRGVAYAWLARRLGIAKNACHIGMFDLVTCRKVVDLCSHLDFEVIQ
ncbi:hypothetical protein H0X91_15795 [Burkholderia sp. 9777_1386]|uniref:zinc-finger-containing protein n=1 Tax=Burkholderia sp. 9777_1386 TaxID=2751183 RepID=UPI0018C37EFE|nr:zinc-finger-containing protein [Burkholderia sp. 9777_1386]MBG0871435.1 hypothetical protein [Burkholderia sp. 9777_1386]